MNPNRSLVSHQNKMVLRVAEHYFIKMGVAGQATVLYDEAVKSPVSRTVHARRN